MTYYADETPCTLLAPRSSVLLHAIGWLDVGHPYHQGPIAAEVVAALAELLVNPWQPAAFGGWHDCPFCRISRGPRVLDLNGTTISMGITNLFVPGIDVFYAAPSLILHYMDAHQYAPPAAFCQAVLHCPPMRSMAYLRAIRPYASGMRPPQDTTDRQ